SYAFVSNYERKSGDRAGLIGESLLHNNKISQCVVFWYIISGGNDTNLKIIFVGTVGPASTPAYIALDDIAITATDHCDTIPKGAEASSAGGMVHVTKAALAYNVGMLRLSSTNLARQSQLICLTTWYHMFGGRGLTLQLNAYKAVKTPVLVWQKSPLFYQYGRTTADMWYKVQRTINMNGSHNQLAFDVTMLPRARNDSVVALGPIGAVPGACDVVTDGEGYCDFEFDECEWKSSDGWRRQQKVMAFADPVKGSQSGPDNSAYVLKATRASSSPSGTLVTSPKLPGNKEPQCFEFWYQQTGGKGVELQVEVLANGKNEVVWKKPLKPLTNDWMLGRVQIVQEKAFKVGVRAKFTEGNAQSVSIDDVVLRPEPCTHPAECYFMNDLCGYVNHYEGDFRLACRPWSAGEAR
ncbi:hypothetical protein MTO96_028581, partial [Rhipicephalus appendiculatus]